MNHAAERELRKLSLKSCNEAPSLHPSSSRPECPLLNVCMRRGFLSRRLIKKAEMDRRDKTKGTILADAELNNDCRSKEFVIKAGARESFAVARERFEILFSRDLLFSFYVGYGAMCRSTDNYPRWDYSRQSNDGGGERG